MVSESKGCIKRLVDLFVIIEHFSLSLTVETLYVGGNLSKSAFFAGGRSL